MMMEEHSGPLDNSPPTGGGGDSDTFEEDERESGDRNSAGNRWPEEETLALLKIKTESRDCGWDEVSRRLAELGYLRSASKCKEKFKNIYKYHKRSKESGRQNYHLYEQFELFDIMSSSHSPSPNKTQPPPTKTTNAIGISKTVTAIDTPMMIQPSSSEIMTSTSTSTTSSSGRGSEGDGKEKKKKKKFAGLFDRMMKEVLEKQEKMQKMFIETLEKCENDRIAREEAWKAQELARMEREKEMLAQEKAIIAAKDAAIVALLQKISEQGTQIQLPGILLNPRPNTPVIVKREKNKLNNCENPNQASSSRWPKTEIEALIRLRTALDLKYQDNAPKKPLWEEVSLSMKMIGYDRSATRCKEKWENINKYFRRMKESNKRPRPEDSKTCPYYSMLESIYEKKRKKLDSSGQELKPEDILMQLQQEQRNMIESAVREDGESENVGLNQEDDGDEEYEENGNGYEIVAYNTSSVTSMQ